MSNALRRRIENISSDTNYSNKSFVFSATVLSGYEKSNTCDISFQDKNGHWAKQKNVPVKFDSVGIISWFPIAGDQVIVTQNNGYYEITGLNMKDLKSSRVKNHTTEDILSNFYNYTIGGNIF